MDKIGNVKLKVVGVTFANDNGTNRQAIIKAMGKNSTVMLKREPTNKFDTNAIAVHTIDGQVGYIGKEFAKIIAPLMDAGRKFQAEVDVVDTYEGKYYLHLNVREE